MKIRYGKRGIKKAPESAL